MKPGTIVLKHGLSRTTEYRAWQTMRQRCTNPDNAAYPSYGGRGITICDRWLNSPETFLADLGKKPSPKHEIDRIDNDKGYSPDNCRWATRKENDRNRRSNHHLTLRGERKTVSGWCELLSLPTDTVLKRIEAGWSDEKALTTPVRAKRPSKRQIERAKAKAAAAISDNPVGIEDAA